MSIYYAPKLKAGDVFRADTNAEFLNEVFGTNYKAWMKGTWRYSKSAFAWFVRIDGKSRNEFVNTWLNQDTILQRYIGTEDLWDGEPLKLDAENDYRLVFEIIDKPNRKYVFQGVFLMDRNDSTPKQMIFKKVSDIFPIN